MRSAVMWLQSWKMLENARKHPAAPFGKAHQQARPANQLTRQMARLVPRSLMVRAMSEVHRLS